MRQFLQAVICDAMHSIAECSNVFKFIKARSIMKKQKGVTIIELLVVLAIFGVVMAGLYSSYEVQLKQGVQEYHAAESGMELQIAKSVIGRDIAMTGYGLVKADPSVADTFNLANIVAPISAVPGTNHTVTFRGTALGINNRAPQKWSFTVSSTPTTSADFGASSNPSYDSERLQNNDRIMYMEPNTQQIRNMASGGNYIWLYPYPGGSYPTPMEPGIIAYGMATLSTGTLINPYYTVTYRLGGTPPAFCQTQTQNLLRIENNNEQPLLNCVLGFKVALALDTNDDGSIDCWDDGGVKSAIYQPQILRTMIRQVKLFVLVQSGNRDKDYIYSNPDPLYSTTPDKVRVGDTSLMKCDGGVIGEDFTLLSDQRQFRWTMLEISGTPRNLR